MFNLVSLFLCVSRFWDSGFLGSAHSEGGDSRDLHKAPTKNPKP